MVASIVAKSVPNVDKSVWETSTNLNLVLELGDQLSYLYWRIVSSVSIGFFSSFCNEEIER